MRTTCARHAPKACSASSSCAATRCATPCKNALLPVVTIIGIEFAFLMGGLVVTEQVFNLNGLGKLFVESISNHDYNMTQALVMLVVAIFALTNLVVDIIYAWLDPRIRYA